ncbi:unnamed protein product [Ectocarpus sp. CCAP 1310/34]|nr:unnamed protein product [Ectocarpus sp. CCAP 1310/34]
MRRLSNMVSDPPVSTSRPTRVELAAKLRPEMREHVANMKPLSKASSSRVKSTTATSLFESCLLDADEQLVQLEHAVNVLLESLVSSGRFPPCW